MQIIFQKEKQKEFLTEAIKLSKSKNINQFCNFFKFNRRTFKNWHYETNHLPQPIYNKLITAFPKLKKFNKFILEKKESNWGQKKGGKSSYNKMVLKYGEEELKNRQKNGGKKSKRYNEPLSINIYNKQFLEFYGALLGDGWISIIKSKKTNKIQWIIGFSGHSKDDKNYLSKRIKGICKPLFSRTGYLHYKPNTNSMEFTFGHKKLLYFLNNNLNFPIGLKKNLKISEKYNSKWENYKYIIRGLFDTDGSLYFDKDPRYKTHYPILEISNKSDILVEQIKKILISQNFRIIRYHSGLRLKGKDQLERWFKKIKPKNKKHILKYKKFISNNKGP
ncbi:hypothetical protein HOD38_04010 [archaeon]|jgi:hypothetical protein|nr:hypothetical protein [archaeon]MBT4397407.1 hypothetical protein [archaeon]MBT4440479.1 hypothetical protein [archaeon]